MLGQVLNLESTVPELVCLTIIVIRLSEREWKSDTSALTVDMILTNAPINLGLITDVITLDLK